MLNNRMEPIISIVIPVYNEERNLINLYNQISNTKMPYDYEIIFVDDGSKDNSFKILEQLAKKNRKIKVIKLMSNYGQSSAIAAGISNAMGKCIVTMDSDLQHNPKDIPSLIKPLENGYHVVCGWRKNRKDSDSFTKKTIPSILSNFLINRMTKLRLHDTTGGMRAFNNKVTNIIPVYGDMHRYLPILAYWRGFKVTEIPIDIRKRKFGKTKYNFTRLFSGFLDLLTIKYFVSYSIRPIQIFGKVGFGTFLLGFLTGLYILYDKLVNNVGITTEHQPLLMLCILLIILGVNFLCFGLIADMISYESIKKENTYIIDKIINK